MQTSTLKLYLMVFGCLVFGSLSATATAQDDQSNINMILGDVHNVNVEGLTRVSITDPDIADIADATENEVSLVARRMGHTILFVWDGAGKKVFSVNVAGDDLEKVRRRIEDLLKNAGITTVQFDTNYVEGKVVLSGNVNKDQKVRLDKVLEPFTEQVINLTKSDEAQELIQIDMQIVEMSATYDKNVGMNWSGDTGQGPLKLIYEENENTQLNGSKDWFKLGQFNRTNTIINTINLLISEGKARTLSRPRILVTSGKEATVNVGGEVPIQSTVSNASSNTTESNVTFKQYGLTVAVTPTIKEGKIDVLLNLQQSDIDSTFPVTATTTNGVAYKTRNAQTQLMLDNKQTVLLAGLIRYTDGQVKKSIPILGKVPLIGGLFRNTSKQAPDEAKELIITLTPVIVLNKKIATDQVKMPTQALNDFVDEAEKLHNYQREPVDPDPNAPDQYSVRNSKTMTPAKVKRVEKPMPVQKPKVILEESKNDSKQEPIETVQKYMQDIQVKISQNISYPYEALKNKWQGTVKLKLNILKDGTLISASIAQSSGKQVFDDDALSAAKIAAPYAPFSKDMQANDLNVTIPIVYQAK